jgi:hypothetical protein
MVLLSLHVAVALRRLAAASLIYRLSLKALGVVQTSLRKVVVK